ncbi:MAG TPA: hypothetical protein VIE65_04250 [Methylobacter sp.]|jgi:hypothetical protein
MDEFTKVAMTASNALRALIKTNDEEEATHLIGEIEAVHLPALGVFCPIIAAATQGLLCDIVRTRARRGSINLTPSTPPSTPPSSSH